MKLASVATGMLLALVIALLAVIVVSRSGGSQQQVVQTLSDVPGSTAHIYGLHDSVGNPMDTLKITSPQAGAYIGVYHTCSAIPQTCTVKVAISADLLNWRYWTDLEASASQPTVFRLGSDYVVAVEKEPNNHVQFRHYRQALGLITGHADAVFDAPQTLSTCAEGTPNIFSGTYNGISGDVFHSTLYVGLHYFRNCDLDCQVRGALVNFMDWTAAPDDHLNMLFESLTNPSIGGNVGDRDYFVSAGERYNIHEAQLVKGDFSTWRLYLYDYQADQLTSLPVNTNGHSTSFANPTVTALFAPDGSPVLVMTYFLPSEGAAAGEAGELLFYSPLASPASASPTAIASVTPTPGGIGSANPCVHAPALAQWNHVVVLMFENKTYGSVIGSPSAPFINSLVAKCGTSSPATSAKNGWHDANYRVDGTPDGSYVSKPSYATLTNGVPPSVHGLTDDSYSTQTGVTSIYDQLRAAGRTFKDYYDAGDGGCGVRFSGDYHDPIRYYSSLGAICNAHDVPLSSFMADVNAGDLPAFSVILPTNDENMHDNSISSGDTWAKNFLTPLLDSAQYQSGDTAIFFLWDEDTPIPNVLIAPSIIPSSKVPLQTGNPISHFAGLRTFEEMLGLPFTGDVGSAPSLLSYYEGK